MADSHLPSQNSIGKKEISFPISSFTEFDPIKAVIVGYVDETAFLTEDLIGEGNSDSTIQKGKAPKEIVEEAQKNQDALAKKFQELGIEVVRPGQVDWS